MSSQRRTTRSAKATIPDIPLPPRRDPPKKIQKGKPSGKSSKTSTTSINSNSATGSLKENTSTSASNKDFQPEATQVYANPITNHETPTSNAAAPVASNLPFVSNDDLVGPKQLNVDVPTAASALPSRQQVDSTVQERSIPSWTRPRPVPITAANRKTARSVDDMFILSNRGFCYRPQHPSRPPSNPPSGKASSRASKTKTFVNSLGISVEYEDSSDAGDDAPAYQRRSAVQRSPTPCPSVDDRNDLYRQAERTDDDEEPFDQEEEEGNQARLHQVGTGQLEDPEDGEGEDDDSKDEEHAANERNSDSDDEEREDLIESEDSQSDFDETAKELKRKHAQKAQYTVRPLTPTMSEQDEEDERDFEKEFAKTTTSSPPRIPALKKGKGRAHDNFAHNSGDEDAPGEDSTQTPPDDDTPEDDFEDTGVGMCGQYSSGPISNEDKEAAFEAHAEMIEKLETIAQRCNKPLKHFLTMVGQYAKPTCALSSWEVYQPWYSACVKKKPDDVKIQLWTKFEVSVAYNRKLKDLHDKIGTTKPSREEIEEHFKEQFDFYRRMIKNYITAKKDSKQFAAVVSKVIEPFVRMSTQVSEELGIHIFGFAVETSPDSCSSVAWGGSREYKVLRDQHKTVLQTQLHDYEGMFKVAEMQGRVNPASKLKSFVDIRKKDKETERDYLRRILGEFFRSDLARIFSGRDKSSADKSSHASKPNKMTWSWTDHAYDNDLRIINWEKDVAFPQNQFDPKKISHDTLKKMVKPRITWYQRLLEAENHDSSDDMDVDLEEEFLKLVQIVSWTEEERTRELKDKHSIPLVMDVGGRSVLKAFDSKHYIASMKNVGARIPNYTPSDQRSSDSDSTQRPCPQSLRLEQSGRSGPSSKNVATTHKQQKRKRKRDRSPAFVEVGDSESEDSAPAMRGRTLARPKPTSSRRRGDTDRTTPSTPPHSCDRNLTAASKSQPAPPRKIAGSNNSRTAGSDRTGATAAHSQSRSPSHPSSSKPLTASHQQVHVQSQSPSPPPSHPSRLPGPSTTHTNDRLPAASPTHQRIVGRNPSASVHVRDLSVEPGQDPARSKSPAMASNSGESQHRQLYPEPRRPMFPVENRNNVEHECQRESSTSRHEARGLQPQQGAQRHFNMQVNSGDEHTSKRRRIHSENSPPFPHSNGHHNNREPSDFPQMGMGPTSYVDRRNEYINNQQNHHFNTERNYYMDQRTQSHNYPHGQYWDQSNNHPVPQDHIHYPPPRPDRYPTQPSYTRYNGYPQDRNASPGPSYHQYGHSSYRNHEYYK